MNMDKQTNWHLEVYGEEGNVTFYGVNIFDYKWKDTGKSVQVKDPLYKQTFTFPVYVVSIDGIDVKFAAGEFSPYVWGFYVPR